MTCFCFCFSNSKTQHIPKLKNVGRTKDSKQDKKSSVRLVSLCQNVFLYLSTVKFIILYVTGPLSGIATYAVTKTIFIRLTVLNCMETER